MAASQKHIDRIMQELEAAGLSKYALGKGESRRLPDMIHTKEHVHAAVMGRKDLVTNAMLVATDRKVLHIQYSPFFMNTDEITYEVVSGVTFGRQGLTNSLTLHTRIGDFNLKLVNASAAERFIAYIEERRLEGDGDTSSSSKKSNNGKVSSPAKSVSRKPQYDFSRKERSFLQTHELSVLSSLGPDGRATGAAVYYMFDGDFLYIVTKEGTEKAHNILRNPDVALTVTDEAVMATMQIDANAVVETDNDKRQAAFNAIVKPRQYKDGAKYPPVAALNAGAFVVIRLVPSSVRYSEFAAK